MKEKKTNLAFNIINRVGTWDDLIEMYAHPDCPVEILLEGAKKWSQIDSFNLNTDGLETEATIFATNAIGNILKNPNVNQEIFEVIKNADTHPESLKFKTHPYSAEVKDYIKDQIKKESKGIYNIIDQIFKMDKLFLSGSSMVFFLSSALGKNLNFFSSSKSDFIDFIKKWEIGILKDLDFFFKNAEDRSEFVNTVLQSFSPQKNEDHDWNFSYNDGKIETKGSTFIPGHFKFGLDSTIISGGISKNAISIGNCQFIIRDVGSPDSIVEKFDFCHCQSFFDFSEDRISFPPKFLRSIKTGKLIYNSRCQTYPINTLQRANKFSSRGWELPRYQLLKIVEKLLSKDINDGLKENLDGYYSEVSIDENITDFHSLIEKVKEQIHLIDQD